jgi:hypothetical protein
MEKAAAKALAKADGKKPPWQKKSSQSTSSNEKGCAWCFNDPALRSKSLTHSSKDCYLDPQNKGKGSKGKGTKTSNLHLKNAIREVLNEPAEKAPKKDKKRKHKQRRDTSESESGEESDDSRDDDHPKGKPRKN